MAGGGGGKGDYGTNTTIIPMEAGSRYRPRNLITAISEIQQYFVIESNGQEIPAEFFTLEGSLDLFRIGIRSGFNEGLIVILLFPIFSFYLLPFVFKTPDLLLNIIIGSIPYLALVINTILCMYISQYYVGNITRRAINSLFIGRGTMLLLKAVLIYVFYQVLYKLSTPEYVWAAVQRFGNAENLYNGYFSILPKVIPISTEIAVFMAVAAIIPYGTVYVLDVLRQRRIKNNNRAIGKF